MSTPDAEAERRRAQDRLGYSMANNPHVWDLLGELDLPSRDIIQPTVSVGHSQETTERRIANALTCVARSLDQRVKQEERRIHALEESHRRAQVKLDAITLMTRWKGLSVMLDFEAASDHQKSLIDKIDNQIMGYAEELVKRDDT